MEPTQAKVNNMKDVLETEFSEEFVSGMRDRMVVSFYKYGPLKNAYPTKVKALDSIEQRLRKYKETKNTEYLIDAANFAMIEFMRPSIEGAHFTPTDDSGSPGRISRKTGAPSKADNDSIG